MEFAGVKRSSDGKILTKEVRVQELRVGIQGALVQASIGAEPVGVITTTGQKIENDLHAWSTTPSDLKKRLKALDAKVMKDIIRTLRDTNNLATRHDTVMKVLYQKELVAIEAVRGRLNKLEEALTKASELAAVSAYGDKRNGTISWTKMSDDLLKMSTKTASSSSGSNDMSDTEL